MTTWPRLSIDLKHARHLAVCQACGVVHNPHGRALHRWLEHDTDDQPEPVCVVLCDPCATRLIDPHPRLYRRMQHHEPLPGAMPICADCRHRADLACRNPDAAINGGPGLSYTLPPPIRAFVDRTDANVRRRGGCEAVYVGPVSGCAGKEAAEKSGELKAESGEV